MVEELSDLWKPGAMDGIPPFVMNCNCILVFLNSMTCVDKPKESLKTLFICQFSQLCKYVVVSYSYADSVAVRSNLFC